MRKICCLVIATTNSSSYNASMSGFCGRALRPLYCKKNVILIVSLSDVW